MKKVVIIVVILIVLAAGAYLGRHQISSMMGTPAPTSSATQAVVSPASSASESASASNIYMSKTSPVKGTYMTDFQGMTLYTYDKDTTGVSNCYGGCAQAWPPYTSGATAQNSLPANITVITRTDGTKQFAWKGMPLYYYATDSKAGDITGDGVGGVWHIIKL